MQIGESRVLAQVNFFQAHFLCVQPCQFCVGREVQAFDGCVGAGELDQFGVLAQVDGLEVVSVDFQFRQVCSSGHVDGGNLRPVHVGDGGEVVDALSVDFDGPVSYGCPGNLRVQFYSVIDCDFRCFYEFSVSPVDLVFVSGFRSIETERTRIAVHFSRQGDGRCQLCLR